MTCLELTRADLEPTLAAHTGNMTFEQCLHRITEGDSLIRLLGRYIHFNSVFGGGVANLAGEIASRQDLFRDTEEPVALLADRSVEVASDVFFAAVDEFDDRSTPYRDTHRTLAQATLKGTGRFYGYDGEGLNALIQPNEATLIAMEQVRAGYGLNRALEAAQLFRALGFHAGSEILADHEFSILDAYLRAAHPQLVAFLNETKVEINGASHQSYFWIQIHTSVEADHFAYAAKGANRALRYYTGQEAAQAKQWLIEGFAAFADVQAAFMEGLAA